MSGSTEKMLLELEPEECAALLRLIAGARDAPIMAGEGAGTFEHLGSASAKIEQASGVSVAEVLFPNDGREWIDFSDLTVLVDEEHARLDRLFRELFPHLLRIVTPASGDDLPTGAVVSEISPLNLLRNIRFVLAVLAEALDRDAAQNPRLAEAWAARREQFLKGEGDVLFDFRHHFETFVDDAFILSLMMAVVTFVRDKVFADQPAEGKQVADGLFAASGGVGLFDKKIKRILEYGPGRRPKQIPPEGTPLYRKVHSFLLGKAKRDKGKVIFPSVAGKNIASQLVEELNRCPEFSQLPRKVIKGGSKRRKWNSKMLYGRLKDDGSPFPAIKKEVAALVP